MLSCRILAANELCRARITVPAQGGVYWNGEAMTKTDFKDLDETPSTVASVVSTMAANAAHLAADLARNPYPAA